MVLLVGIFAIPWFIVSGGFTSLVRKCESAKVRVAHRRRAQVQQCGYFRTFVLSHFRTQVFSSFTTAISSHACSFGHTRQSAHTFSGNISLGTVR